jgi:hypothetical protein
MYKQKEAASFGRFVCMCAYDARFYLEYDIARLQRANDYKEA